MKNILAILVIISSLSVFAKGGKASEPKFVYAIVEMTEGQPEIWLNPISTWKEEGCLSDSYSEEELKYIEPIIDEAKLCNLAESMYEPCRAENLEESLKVLAKYNVVNLEAFQKWAEAEVQ